MIIDKIAEVAGWLRMLPSPNQEKCSILLYDNAARFNKAWGSSHNHQAWPGGYLDHLLDTMTIAFWLDSSLTRVGLLPFKLSDAILVLFLHDLEKPWKEEKGFKTKEERAAFRRETITRYGIALTEEQENAIRYVEGEGDDYRSDRRVMNELAAFCHMCDVASARIWHSKSVSSV